MRCQEDPNTEHGWINQGSECLILTLLYIQICSIQQVPFRPSRDQVISLYKSHCWLHDYCS